jgi:hypothetical protein
MLTHAAFAAVDSLFFSKCMQTTDNYQADFFMYERKSWNYKDSEVVSHR